MSNTNRQRCPDSRGINKNAQRGWNTRPDSQMDKAKIPRRKKRRKIKQKDFAPSPCPIIYVKFPKSWSSWCPWNPFHHWSINCKKGKCIKIYIKMLVSSADNQFRFDFTNSMSEFAHLFALIWARKVEKSLLWHWWNTIADCFHILWQFYQIKIYSLVFCHSWKILEKFWWIGIGFI